MSRRTRRTGSKRSYRWLVIPLLVAVTAIVGYYIFTQSGTAGGSSPLNGQPASAEVLNDLAGVSANTLNQVGIPSPSIVNPPTAISGATALTINGKPGVLYMGAEYCPYCAAERWSMIVALDKFGNFTGIQYMQSASTDVYPNTPTFSFVGATYTSKYIAFESVEQADRNQAPLQSATAAQTSLMTTYDTGGTIPFLDIGNQYKITSSQYIPSALRVGDQPSGAPYNWTQIAPQLDNASSIFAVNIDGTANTLIAAICKIDGGQPSSVCSQGYASTVSYTKNLSPSGPQLISDAILGGQVLPVTSEPTSFLRIAYRP
jgi:thiol-disulfide isomerase/thioredoxin